MKKIKKLSLILLTSISLSVPAAAAEPALGEPVLLAETSGETETPKQPVKNGWNTLANGKRQFLKNGVPVTGIRKISGKTFCFDKKGYLVCGRWYTKDNKKYRTDKSGSPVTGLKKIGGKTYYFNSKGVMQTGTVTLKKVTYYFKDNGQLEARKSGSKYYDANGKQMNSVKANQFETLQRAKGIVKKITTSKMTKQEKLKKCFDWVVSKPYVTRRRFSNTQGWPAVYANDHFVLGGGNCFSDAAAFAYLAKALGYTKVYVCVDSDGRGGSGHSWAEVNGLVYDPLFAEAKGYSKNYGVRYGVYVLHPILHIAI
ncbi:MAG TPA: hypothetical protein IAA21_04680 [Candidatus Blautia faecigallinarum]|uniref:Transglutaminase-like domain-containing protein n=1 Tax=Candidatus Blautia faecigallinarum TaxID=2838488 RepID=A0A9D2ISY6_9FIRM|nr:hypothetical protein [Candidatus Blautia faecigallinarum]